jgi:hypothetical protein
MFIVSVLKTCNPTSGSNLKVKAGGSSPALVLSTRLHCVTSQNTIIFTSIAVRTPNSAPEVDLKMEAAFLLPWRSKIGLLDRIWRWRQHVHPKWCLSTRLCSVTFKNTASIIFVGVRTSSYLSSCLFYLLRDGGIPFVHWSVEIRSIKQIQTGMASVFEQGTLWMVWQCLTEHQYVSLSVLC